MRKLATIAIAWAAWAGALGAEVVDPSPSGKSGEAGKHLMILAGEAGMERFNEAEHFVPAVQSALGKGKVVVAKSAKSGQAIHRWYRDMRWETTAKQPEDAGVLFANLLQHDIDRALASQQIADADGFESVTLIWMQGRSDAVEAHAEAYHERLKGLIRQMKLFRERHDLNVVIVRTSDHQADDPFVQMVRKAQVQVAEELPRAAWVDVDDLNGPNNGTQLTEDGRKVLGERMAQKALELIKGAPRRKHLFILSGQSNMYNLSEGYFTPYVETLYGRPNVTVVKSALGGKPISRWYKKWISVSGKRPELIGDLYDVLMEKVRESTGDQDYDTATLVWMQGESDTGADSAGVYGQSLKGLVRQLSDDLGRDDLNVVIGRINSSILQGKASEGKKASWRVVRETQVKVARELPRAAWVDTDDLWNEETHVHMTKDGYRKLGMRFAKAAAELIAVQAGKGWDERLAGMIPTHASLPRDQRIAYVLDQGGGKSTDDNWHSVGSPAGQKREWRHVSLDPADGKPIVRGKHDPRLDVIALPDRLSGWFLPEFDDSSWTKGAAPIGRGEWKEKGSKVVNQSDWGEGEHLLARTAFEVDSLDYTKFRISVLCRYGNVVYLNGHEIRNYPWNKSPAYFAIPLDESEMLHLRHGRNVIAVYANTNETADNDPVSLDVDIEGCRPAGKKAP